MVTPVDQASGAEPSACCPGPVELDGVLVEARSVGDVMHDLDVVHSAGEVGLANRCVAEVPEDPHLFVVKATSRTRVETLTT